MPFNFYETHTLLMAVQQLTPATSFLRDRYFPTNDATDLFSTTDVIVEYRDGDRMIAPYVVPRKGGVTVLRQGYTASRVTPPYVAPKRMLTYDDLRNKGFGEALMQNLTPEQRQRTLLLRDAQELSAMITRREEQMCAEVMQTNACTMKHIADDEDEPLELKVQYYDGGSNPASYTPTGNWAATYDGIVGDIGAMIRMLTTEGLQATEIICGVDAADAILANDTIKELLNIRNYHVGEIIPESLPQGVANLGRIVANGHSINILCYEEQYKDYEDGETKYYIDAKNVIVTAPGAGRVAYGAVTQVEQSDREFHTYASKRVPKYVSNADGNTRTLTMTSRPIAMPVHKNPFIVAKVLA